MSANFQMYCILDAMERSIKDISFAISKRKQEQFIYYYLVTLLLPSSSYNFTPFNFTV